jgi:hydrogenase nickel incorporation protein HypA/HybF
VHEYSIVASIVERVEAEVARAGAIAVRRLTVEIGVAAGVEIELLRSAWEIFRDGTVCAGAELDIEAVPVAWACTSCGATPEKVFTLRCSACSSPLRMVRGDDLTLRQIEMEVREPCVTTAVAATLSS